MTPIPGQNNLVVIDDDTIALRPKSSRRTIYLLLFVLLATAAVMGFDPGRDLSGTRLIGTIGFVVVALALLGFAGISTSVIFDRRNKRCSRRQSLFSFTLKDTSLNIEPAAHLVCQEVELMKSPEANGKSGFLAGFLTARTHLYRLFLVTSGTGADDEAEASADSAVTREEAPPSRVKLEETTYPEGISELGKAIADFMAIPFETESL